MTFMHVLQLLAVVLLLQLKVTLLNPDFGMKFKAWATLLAAKGLGCWLLIDLYLQLQK